MEKKTKKEFQPITLLQVPIKTARLLRSIAEDKGLNRMAYIIQVLNEIADRYEKKKIKLFED